MSVIFSRDSILYCMDLITEATECLHCSDKRVSCKVGAAGSILYPLRSLDYTLPRLYIITSQSSILYRLRAPYYNLSGFFVIVLGKLLCLVSSDSPREDVGGTCELPTQCWTRVHPSRGSLE